MRGRRIALPAIDSHDEPLACEARHLARPQPYEGDPTVHRDGENGLGPAAVCGTCNKVRRRMKMVIYVQNNYVVKAAVLPQDKMTSNGRQV